LESKVFQYHLQSIAFGLDLNSKQYKLRKDFFTKIAKIFKIAKQIAQIFLAIA